MRLGMRVGLAWVSAAAVALAAPAHRGGQRADGLLLCRNEFRVGGVQFARCKHQFKKGRMRSQPDDDIPGSPGGGRSTRISSAGP